VNPRRATVDEPNLIAVDCGDSGDEFEVVEHLD
jgi:hypothetical protein